MSTKGQKGTKGGVTEWGGRGGGGVGGGGAVFRAKGIYT